MDNKKMEGVKYTDSDDLLEVGRASNTTLIKS